MKTTLINKPFRMIAFIIFFLGITGIAVAQNDGKERTYTGVTDIVVKGSLDLTLKNGESGKLILENEKVRSEVKDGILYLEGKGKASFDYSKLNSIRASESANIMLDGELKNTAFKIELSGASELKGQINVTDLTAELTGASEANISGTAQGLLATASGASDLKAQNLVVTKAKIVASGASEVRMTVNGELDVDVSGASDVKYYGNPGVVNKRISGAAELRSDNGNASIDTVSWKLGEKNITLFNDDKDDDKKDHKRKDVLLSGIDLGINGFLTSDNKTKMLPGNKYLELDYAKSINVNIYVPEVSANLVKDHIRLVSGLGLEINNYRLENNYRLLADSSFSCAEFDTIRTYKKNKLNSVYLTVPLLFQFDTRKDKNGNTLHVSLGGYGSVRIAAHTKRMWLDNNEVYKPKSHDDYNLSTFRYGLMVRMGYGRWNVYATYALSEFFKSGQGPKLYPFSVGITLAAI
ncbi:MAG: DUF2807 domain-containing protein [Bacteroidota bacterium]